MGIEVSKKTKERVDFIDIAKAIGMICVIWGHIIVEGRTTSFVYSFHIPLFFFLSGMVYNKAKYQSFWMFLKRKIKTLMVPYIVMSFATWLVWAGYNFLRHNTIESYFKPLLETFIARGSSEYLLHNAPLWFVTCLLSVEILYYFIGKTRKPVNISICFIFGAIGYVMVSPKWGGYFPELPWSLESSFSALLFYSVGNLLSPKICNASLREKIGRNKLVSIIIVIISSVVLFILSNRNGEVSMGSNMLGDNILLFYLLAFLGIGTVLTFAIILDECMPDNMFNKALHYIGKNSFYYMAVHHPIKGYVLKAAGKLTGISVKVLARNEIYGIVSFMIVITLSTVIVFGINKIIKCVSKRKIIYSA